MIDNNKDIKKETAIELNLVDLFPLLIKFKYLTFLCLIIPILISTFTWYVGVQRPRPHRRHAARAPALALSGEPTRRWRASRAAYNLYETCVVPSKQSIEGQRLG